MLGMQALFTKQSITMLNLNTIVHDSYYLIAHFISLVQLLAV